MQNIQIIYNMYIDDMLVDLYVCDATRNTKMLGQTAITWVDETHPGAEPKRFPTVPKGCR